MIQRKQATILLLMLAMYMIAAVVYALMPGGALATAAMFGQSTTLAPWQIALGNALLIAVVYGPAGFAGLWLAHKADLPGIYRPNATRNESLVGPLWIGVLVGGVLVVVDLAAKYWTEIPELPHPPFPASILASVAAGIGEEIIFRLLIMSLWTVVLGWILGRIVAADRARGWSQWAANGLAALAFAAGHLGTAMVIAGVVSPVDLPPVMLLQIFILNGLVGVVSGLAFVREGLVAAAGVHFWADVVWHVLYGLFG